MSIFLTMRSKVFAKAAKCFPANTDIRSDHVLGDALYTSRVALNEFEILFFCRFCMGLNDSFLSGDKVVLYNNAEIMFKLGNVLHECIPGRFAEKQKFRIFHCFYSEM